MKIGLGTAQFGLNYGISNKDGQTSLDEIDKILDTAIHNDVKVIDTSTMYGNSEEALGKTLHINHRFKIITKTPSFNSSVVTSDDLKRLEDSFLQSLFKMKSKSIYGLLMHNADDLLNQQGQSFFSKMIELKEKGLVEKVGVSVYTASQIDGVLENFQIDIIQLPINVFDQRLLVNGHLSKLKKRGIEIHARSVFLQGLLLMSPETLPPFLSPLKEHLDNYQRAIYRQGLTLVRAALGFLVSIPEIDFIICGVNNQKQLKEICTEAIPVESIDYSIFSIDDEMILNPSNWEAIR